MEIRGSARRCRLIAPKHHEEKRTNKKLCVGNLSYNTKSAFTKCHKQPTKRDHRCQDEQKARGKRSTQ
jgi:hypothetical protein